MHQLDKLKKIYNLKKLISFLSFYPYVIFYYSTKTKNHKNWPFSYQDGAYLFLVKHARLCKLATLFSPKGLGFGSLGDVSPSKATLPITTLPDSLVALKKMVALAFGGRFVGKTFLVGTHSLEGMQKILEKSFSPEKQVLTMQPNNLYFKNQTNDQLNLKDEGDFICLGALWGLDYINPKDCCRLAPLKAHKVNCKLVHTLNGVAPLMVHQLSLSLVRTFLVLKWKSSFSNQ